MILKMASIHHESIRIAICFKSLNSSLRHIRLVPYIFITIFAHKRKEQNLLVYHANVSQETNMPLIDNQSIYVISRVLLLTNTISFFFQIKNKIQYNVIYTRIYTYIFY